MRSRFRSRWPEPTTSDVASPEADTTNATSPSSFSSLFGSPGTPETGQEQISTHWSLDPHAQAEQGLTISPLTTPRQRRNSPHKPNTPVSRTTPVGSIQKPISSNHLTKNLSILWLNRPRTPTPHSSPTRLHSDAKVDGALAFTPPPLRHGYELFEKDNVEHAEDMVSSCRRSSRSSRFEPYPNTSSPGSERREYCSPPISYVASSPSWQYPFCGYTSQEVFAMKKAESGTRDTASTVDDNGPLRGIPTTEDSLSGSSPPSPDAEYTSDSETLSSIPPSPQDTSLMSLDQHLCCWKTGDNAFKPMMCGWESLSHEDLWQHVMCKHLIEVLQGRLVCGWVFEFEGRDGRAVCGGGIGSLEEMREHDIEHVRNGGGRVGGGEYGGLV